MNSNARCTILSPSLTTALRQRVCGESSTRHERRERPLERTPVLILRLRPRQFPRRRMSLLDQLVPRGSEVPGPRLISEPTRAHHDALRAMPAKMIRTDAETRVLAPAAAREATGHRLWSRWYRLSSAYAARCVRLSLMQPPLPLVDRLPTMRPVQTIAASIAAHVETPTTSLTAVREHIDRFTRVLAMAEAAVGPGLGKLSSPRIQTSPHPGAQRHPAAGERFVSRAATSQQPPLETTRIATTELRIWDRGDVTPGMASLTATRSKAGRPTGMMGTALAAVSKITRAAMLAMVAMLRFIRRIITIVNSKLEDLTAIRIASREAVSRERSASRR